MFAILLIAAVFGAEKTKLSALTPADPLASGRWCQDLGVFSGGGIEEEGEIRPQCIADPRGDGRPPRSLEILNRTDPAKFLPDEWVAAIGKCRDDRRKAYPFAEQLADGHCAKIAPLRDGGLSRIVFIPPGQVEAARLPPSGARLVSDCDGRQLQIRDDLSPVQLAKAMKAALELLAGSQLAVELPKVPRVSDTRLEVWSCEVELESKPTHYTIEVTDTGKFESIVFDPLNRLPEAYYRRDCVGKEAARRRSDTPEGRKRAAEVRLAEAAELKRFQVYLRDNDSVRREMGRLGCLLMPPEAPQEEGKECARLRARFMGLGDKHLKGRHDDGWLGRMYLKASQDVSLAEDQALAYRLSAELHLSDGIGMREDHAPELVEQVEATCFSDPCLCFGTDTMAKKMPEDIHGFEIALSASTHYFSRSLLELCKGLQENGGCEGAKKIRCPMSPEERAELVSYGEARRGSEDVMDCPECVLPSR
jgi:hypothetical protein